MTNKIDWSVIDIPKTQSVMAVIFTPITGAIAIAIVSFNYITSISHWILGCLGFIGAFLGVEAVGGACCYALIKCHREKDYGADFWTALAGTVAYITVGILTLYLQNPIAAFFALSPFGYFAYSIIRTMADEISAKTEETNAQIELIKAQTRLTNAQARKEKAEMSGRPGVRETGRTATGTRDKVYEYLSDNPEASVRKVAGETGLPKSTVEPYVSEFKSFHNGNGNH